MLIATVARFFEIVFMLVGLSVGLTFIAGMFWGFILSPTISLARRLLA